MNKTCTAVDQSKKLIELGIDVNTADMCYLNDIKLNANSYNVAISLWSDYYEITPAWSLSALLGLMPKVISIKVGKYSAYRYDLEWQFANDNSLRYVGHNRKCLIDIYSDHDDEWKDSIDTAFEMVCWLLENRKICG